MDTGKKAVFFDADGTICDMREGIPESARRAVRRLRKNGHQAWLCTGRSRAFVPDNLAGMGFDGIIAACGAYMEKDGAVLFNREMSPKTARRSVEILRRNGMIPVMEGAEYMYYDKDEYTSGVDWFCDLITETLGERWRPICGNEDRMRINKISAKVRPGSKPERAVRELSPWYDAIIHSGGLAGGTIEFVPKEFSKAVGIAAACGSFQIPWESTVIFGDSDNDLSMFEYAAVKVAMGNAPEEIKRLADYVTADMFHEGIREGLAHLGLI